MTTLRDITKEQFENALKGIDQGIEGIKFNVDSTEYGLNWPKTIVFANCKIDFLEVISINLEKTHCCLHGFGALNNPNGHPFHPPITAQHPAFEAPARSH
jgi:hypothetical protein